jgi:hypothetical protein
MRSAGITKSADPSLVTFFNEGNDRPLGRGVIPGREGSAANAVLMETSKASTPFKINLVMSALPLDSNGMGSVSAMRSYCRYLEDTGNSNGLRKVATPGEPDRIAADALRLCKYRSGCEIAPPLQNKSAEK